MTEPGYPQVPDQARFTIGEVCDLCLIKQHTLRYWEKLYPRLSKVERRNSRRYYTVDDIHLIRRIRGLKDQGLTPQGISAELDGKTARQAPPAGLPPSRIKAEILSISKLLER